MKTHKFVRKHFIDIFFLIILLVIFLGGIIAPGNASADITDSGNAPSSSITDLMRPANINKAVKPDISPDFSLISIYGDKVQLSRKQGKVVMLSFWATW